SVTVVVRWGARGASSSASPSTSAAAAATTSEPRFEPSGFHRITFDDGCEEFPSFTPDGRAVVYDGAVGADSALFVLTLADQSRRRLTTVHGWDFAASVSPDGKRVAFLRSSPDE